MTGVEEYEEVLENAAKDEAELKISKVNFNSAENSLRRRHRSRDGGEKAIQPLSSSRFTDRMLDRRKTKVDVSADVFGKPGVLIRTNPAAISDSKNDSSAEKIPRPSQHNQDQLTIGNTINTQRQ